MLENAKHENISGICSSVCRTNRHMLSLPRLFYFLQRHWRYTSLHKSATKGIYSSLHKSTTKSQETGLTERESWNLLYSFNPRHKKARSILAYKAGKMVCMIFKLSFKWLFTICWWIIMFLNTFANKVAVWLVCLVSIALFSVSSSRGKSNLLSVMVVFPCTKRLNVFTYCNKNFISSSKGLQLQKVRIHYIKYKLLPEDWWGTDVQCTAEEQIYNLTLDSHSWLNTDTSDALQIELLWLQVTFAPTC